MHSDEAIIIVKKPKKGHAEGHGGAWKVAFADFMTAMMAFFLVMWILGMSQEAKEAIAAYFSDPSGFMDKYGKGAAALSSDTPQSEGLMSGMGANIMGGIGIDQQKTLMQEAKKKLDKTLKENPDFKNLRGFVEISIAEGGLRIELVEGGESVFFESAKWELKPTAKRLLHMMAKPLAQTPNPISIEGNTDARPVRAGLGYTNWELSTERANAARRALLEGGFPEKRVLAVQGYADRNPRIPSDPNHFSNRRVSILVHYMPDPAEAIQKENIKRRLKESRG